MKNEVDCPNRKSQDSLSETRRSEPWDTVRKTTMTSRWRSRWTGRWTELLHAGKNVHLGSDRLARNVVWDSFLHQLSDELKYKLLLTPF